MTKTSPTQPVLEGVFAAAVTPLDASGAPDLAALPKLIDFLAGRGCHGVLLLGTTGEGPSFSVQERMEVVREGLRYRAAAWPTLQILAGTGCANLADTIALTRTAFDLGVDAVVTLPAFYYKDVSPAGIASYYEQVLRAAVPVYRLLGREGMADDVRQPIDGELLGAELSYYVRHEKHMVDRRYWQTFMDFADRVLPQAK